MRLIDADKLMLAIRLDKRPTFRGAKIPPSVKETMFAYLDSAPHIDIVRCKECRYCKKKRGTFKGEPITFYRCTENNRDVESDDYCSFGEREGK